MNRPTLLLALLLSGLAALAFGQQDGAAVETPVIEIPGALRGADKAVCLGTNSQTHTTFQIECPNYPCTCISIEPWCKCP